MTDSFEEAIIALQQRKESVKPQVDELNQLTDDGVRLLVLGLGVSPEDLMTGISTYVQGVLMELPQMLSPQVVANVLATVAIDHFVTGCIHERKRAEAERVE